MELITRTNLRSTAIAAFALGALGSWGLFYEWRCSSGLKPFDAAAWVQAVGTIAAVVAAAVIAGWQQRKQESIRADERKAIAQSFASLLMPSVEIFNEDALLVRRRIDARAKYDELIAPGYPDVPEALVKDIQNLHHLGEPGSLLLRAIYGARRLKSMATVSGYPYRHVSEEFTATTDKVVRLTEEALTQMRALLD